MDVSRAQLDSLLVGFIRQHLRAEGLQDNLISVDTLSNDEYDPTVRLMESDNFLYSRYIAYLEAVDSLEFDEYVKQVDMLLRRLWNLGIPVVAACDFEERLTRKGGYNEHRL